MSHVSHGSGEIAQLFPVAYLFLDDLYPKYTLFYKKLAYKKRVRGFQVHHYSQDHSKLGTGIYATMYVCVCICICYVCAHLYMFVPVCTCTCLHTYYVSAFMMMLRRNCAVFQPCKYSVVLAFVSLYQPTGGRQRIQRISPPLPALDKVC